ncbi:hypothetical protein Cni_G02529 [Canna indica]|uniref:Uncharacterized protein n=1 Tax=Canna indica TaxID=4628 RepID=A0AAQ3JPK0_9LILI|nr:hypothetical protein Cni_G02529 [Canna indica]
MKPLKVLFILLIHEVCVSRYTTGQGAKLVPRGKWIVGASILIGTAAIMLLPIALNVLPFTPQYFVPVARMMAGMQWLSLESP